MRFGNFFNHSYRRMNNFKRKRETGESLKFGNSMLSKSLSLVGRIESSTECGVWGRGRTDEANPDDAAPLSAALPARLRLSILCHRSERHPALHLRQQLHASASCSTPGDDNDSFLCVVVGVRSQGPGTPLSEWVPPSLDLIILNRLKNTSLILKTRVHSQGALSLPSAAHAHVRCVPVNVDQRGTPLSARASFLDSLPTRVL